MARSLRLHGARSLAALASIAFAAPAAAATLAVGPGQTYATPCAAIAAAQAGDTIQVDAAGSYAGDTCAWSTDNLTVTGVNGRAKIDLTGVAPSQQKGIFTISANSATIENFELSGAAISMANGNNGAGIRFQGLNLTVRNCFLHDNQDGILAAPATANTGTILIEKTELANNGAGDGFSHNLYIGDFTQFTLQYSYSHGAKVGHLFKSRAYTTSVLYNRLTDEAGTTASYEVDIPNGGTAYVIGNLIEQSAASQNPTIISFGEEGTPAGYDSNLYVVNNTILNDLTTGTFVTDTTTTPAYLLNNIFSGGGTLTSQSSARLVTNFDSSMGDPKFVDVANYNVHLLAGSACIDRGTIPPSVSSSQSLAPVFEYVHPLSEVARAVNGAIDMGAYEFGTGPDGGLVSSEAGVAPDGASGGSSGSSGYGSSSGGTATGNDGGGSGGAASGSSGGCGCRVSGPPIDAAFALAGEGALLGLVFGRRVLRRRRS